MIHACRWAWAPLFALGCSALIEPDTTRLGGGEDAGVEGFDAGRDRDAGTMPTPDGGMMDPDAGRIVEPDAGMDAGRDAGCAIVPACTGGVITTCEGATTCPLGCSPSGEARCAAMVPSNVDASHWREGARSVDIPATGDVFGLDTTACMARMADSMVVAQGDGSEVCVLMVHDMIVRTGAYLVVSGTRPLVVMATGDVIIEANGVLDVSARLSVPGPGGGLGANQARIASGSSPGGNGRHIDMYTDGGGGGGGFCGRGGAGGVGGVAEGGFGAAAMPIVNLIPLRGGSGGGIGEGGRAAGGPGNVGIGGAGGGALQISALGSIAIDGVILAGGGGGSGGGNSNTFVNWGAGGGGGSGGAVLLESPAITIGMNGGVTTSGGGGGGSASTGAPGGQGENGAETFMEARGGDRGGTDLGAFGGSSGGGNTNDAMAGGTNTRTNANGGGGGGGVGCVVYRTGDGLAPMRAATNTSGRNPPSLTFARVMLR